MARYQPKAELSNLSMNSWAAVQLFRIAADTAQERHHVIDAATIYAVMKTLSDVDLGVVATISFTRAGGLPGVPRVVNTNLFYSVVRHGVITGIGDAPHSLLGP